MVKISKKFKMESIQWISLMIVMGLITILINEDIYFLLLWIIWSVDFYLIKLFFYSNSIKRKAIKS